MPELEKLITSLHKHYGSPEMPLGRGPFELVMRENVCYQVPDTRRAEVVRG